MEQQSPGWKRKHVGPGFSPEDLEILFIRMSFSYRFSQVPFPLGAPDVGLMLKDDADRLRRPCSIKPTSGVPNSKGTI
jgi:hypothetical protein